MFYAMFCFRASPSDSWKSVLNFWLTVKPLLNEKIETMYQHCARFFALSVQKSKVHRFLRH